jgi:hypothetical protein
MKLPDMKMNGGNMHEPEKGIGPAKLIGQIIPRNIASAICSGLNFWEIVMLYI